MIEISGQPAEVSFTVTVTRKDTGIVETYDMIGRTVMPDEKVQEVEIKENK